jgi:RHS repeat-associated protein
MPTRATIVFSVLVGLLIFSLRANAQSNPNNVTPSNTTGLMPYQSYGGVRENINFATGDLNLLLPLLSLPGRNGHDFALGLVYDSEIWNLHATYHDETGSYTFAWEGPGGGWQLNIPILYSGANIVYKSGANSTVCTTYFLAVLNDGSKHPFANYADCYAASGNPPVINSPVTDARDGSFLRLDTSNDADWVVHSKDGRTMHFFNKATGNGGYPNKIEDADGNVVSIAYGSTGITLTDTLGRIVTVNIPQISSPNSTAPQTVSYLDSNGTSRTVTIAMSNFTPAVTFTNPAGAGLPTPWPHPWPSSVTLPNNLQYTFQYNGFGELIKITYPTGGYTRYDFAAYTHFWTDGTTFGTGSIADYREVTARHVCRDPLAGCTTATEETTTYTPTVNSSLLSNQYMDVRDATPDHNRTSYQFAPGSAGSVTPETFAPRELVRSTYQGESTLLRTTQTDYACFDTYGNTTASSVPIRVTTTLNDVAPTSISKIEMDNDSIALLPPVFAYSYYPNACGSSNTAPLDNVLERREYDFGSGAVGPLVRRTDYTYLKTNSVNGVDYTATGIHILDRRLTEKIYDASSSLFTQTTFEYDNYTTNLSASNAVQHDTSFGTSYKTRGNLTATQHWRNTDGVWLTTRNQYDDAGNVLQTTDPKNNTTSFSYADSWGKAACAPTGTSAAYHTKTTNALTQSTKATYNSCSGTVASTTDANTQTTNFSYDLMNRMTQTSLPDGGRVAHTYNEASFPLSVTSTTKITSALNEVGKATVDGVGRVTQTQVTADPDGTVYADTTYDGLERKATVSNPYRTANDPGPTNGVTTFSYDALNRVTQVIPPDGTSTANNVTTTYSGNTTNVTDQQGKKRKSATDALGRLITVWEPDTSGTFVYETDYSYDVLNNLTQVQQKGNDANSADWRTRTFSYNSLSQLLTASNPELGTVTYTYDNDGNLLTKKDARAITITYGYDALNRLTGKTYSNADPAVSYFYDQASYNGLAITNGVGRRTGMSDAAGAEAWSYDAMGRVLTDRRTTNAVTKSTAYTYNLDGSLATLTYPSGRVITYAPGGAGRPLSAVDSANAINYATSVHYSPAGSVCSETNGTSVVSTFTFNSRLQPLRMQATTSGGPATPCSAPTQTGNLLDFTYAFNLGTSDNGNVVSITNNRDTTRTQNFTYDQLNRVATAKTTSTTGANCWGLSFGYDIWANLTSASVAQCSAPALSLSVSAQNKITNTGFSYDASGNLLGDGASSYVFNAESQIKTGAGVTYTYDGDGKRVQKSNGKLYWYGMGSEVLDETDLTGSTTNSSFSEYIFFGGKRIARRDASSSVVYYFADHLATSRVLTNATGSMLDDSDFYPFGGERVLASSSGNTYKFTSKERDSESGLDNFGARYFGSSTSRFMQPDPLLNSGRPEDPQSWNRYSYVRNNPLSRFDPTGLYGLNNTCAENNKKCNDEFRQHADQLKNALKNLQNQLKNVKDPVQKARLEASLKALGTEGDHNGVTVGFGATKGGGAGETTPVNDPVTFKETYNVTLDPSMLKGENDYAVAGAHEGTHVDDINTELANPNGTILSDFSLEYRGYQTSIFAASALGGSGFSARYDGKSYELWNGSWAQVDRNITNFVTRFHDQNGKQTHPETTPHNPWPN